MSAKQLRRYLEVTGRGQDENKLLRAGLSSDSDDDQEQETSSVVNRFALLGTEESEEEQESAGEETKEGNEPERDKTDKKKKQKKKKQKKKKKEMKEEEWLDNAVNETTPSESTEVQVVFERDLFKVEPKMFNYENEFRAMLGQKPIESTTRNHRRGRLGRIVKPKPGWPELRTVGIIMELDRVEGDVHWFKYVHSARYQHFQNVYWMACDHNMDQTAFGEILRECPYHLESLLLMSQVLTNQEEHISARDLIERGIYCCESMLSSRFALHDLNHRLDYELEENRIFFLLLHRHMQLLMKRGLANTALAIGKFIYRLDSEHDPLAIMLIIDTLALEAGQPGLVLQLTDTLHRVRRLDRLPNFAYSKALALFYLAKEGGDRSKADQALAEAIRHFPTLVLQLLDRLNVMPDSALDQNPRMNALAHQRESDGIKLLTSIYISHNHQLWAEASVLHWLETGTALAIASFDEHSQEMEQWQSFRQRFYHGIPRNVKRHAVMWEVENDQDSLITDPVPPLETHRAYNRTEEQAAAPVQDSVLVSLVQSLVPDMTQVDRVVDAVGDLADLARQYVYREQQRPNEEPQ